MCLVAGLLSLYQDRQSSIALVAEIASYADTLRQDSQTAVGGRCNRFGETRTTRTVTAGYTSRTSAFETRHDQQELDRQPGATWERPLPSVTVTIVRTSPIPIRITGLSGSNQVQR